MEALAPIFTVDGEKVDASARTEGPRQRNVQHGGAPAALLTWAAEQVPTPAPMQVARVIVDLMRPAPTGALTLSTEIIREGRQIQLVQTSLLAGDKVVSRANVLRVRTAEVEGLPPNMEPLDAPLPDECPPQPLGVAGFDTNFDIRLARKETARGGHARWMRLKNRVVAGQPISAAMRAMASSDFSNGFSRSQALVGYGNINPDLTTHLFRQPIGEWILLDAFTTRGDFGRGIADSRLADVHGYFGRTVQSLILSKNP